MLSKYVARYLMQTLPISQAEFVYGYALTRLIKLIHSCLWCSHVCRTGDISTMSSVTDSQCDYLDMAGRMT